MRRVLFAAVPLAALFLTACPAKPKNGECKSADDCAAQEGYGKVCVEGRCQECGKDTDCKAGYVCRGNKCEPRPECESDAECTGGKKCEAGHCVEAQKPGCKSDADCPADQTCDVASGQCNPKPPPPAECKVEMIHFDFNASAITDEAKGILEQDANCIKKDGNKHVTVAGHCDERGTTEYNIQLGQRRAEAAKKYLAGLLGGGVTFKVVSYGKERPLNPGHDEAAWAENRRAEITAQ